MPVLKAKGKRTDYKLVGASLPSRVHSYIALYCLAKGAFRAKIITTLLENWIAHQTKDNPPEILIKEIVNRLNLAWKLEKKSGKVVSFTRFSEDVKSDFLGKGLNEETIESILNKVNQ